jgi:RecA-family ATPase
VNAWAEPNPEVVAAWKAAGTSDNDLEVLQAIRDAGWDVAGLAALASRRDRESQLVSSSPGEELEVEWLISQGWTTDEIVGRRYSDGCLLTPPRLRAMQETIGNLRKEVDRESARRLARRMVDEAEAEAEAADNPPPVPICWDELWQTEDDDEWLLYPVIPARRLVTIYSPPKVGKSLLMLELAAGIACGRGVLGAQPQPPRKVLYLDYENDPRGDVRGRLQAMGYGPGDLDNLIYLSYPMLGGLDTDKGGQRVVDIAVEHRVELVVIDTVSRSVEGEENCNDTWLGWYRNTGLKLKAASIAVVRLDHTGKDEEKGMRGGSAKYGDVDAVWALSRITDTTFRLRCTDARLQITERELTLTREVHPVLRHKVEGAGWKVVADAEIAAAIKALDAVGFPMDAGRDRARQILTDVGLRMSNNRLSEALKQRKTCPGQVVSLFETDPSGTGQDRGFRGR